MSWKNLTVLLASTVTIAVASQVVKKAYSYFLIKETTSSEIRNDDLSKEVNDLKNRDINDVILFSDDSIRTPANLLPKKETVPCDGRELSCLKLIRYLKSARETLDVCMYLITSQEITEQVIRLGHKHVVIRVVVDSEMANTPPSQIKRLQEFSFIKVQTTKTPILMHHKFCIIDGPKAIKRKNKLRACAEKVNAQVQISPVVWNKKQSVKPIKSFVMSGSLNWSTQSMLTNYESVIVTSHPNIVNKLEKEFESLWTETDLALQN